MNYMVKARHLDFVSGCIITTISVNPTDYDKNDLIFVFSHRHNGKVYKYKNFCIGYIIKYKRKYCFCSHITDKEAIALCEDTMKIISGFLELLNEKIAVFNPKKGTLKVKWDSLKKN